MMRRFTQINTNIRTNGEQILSATELFLAFKDLSEEFTKEAFQNDINHFDQNDDGLMSYDEYVTYSKYLTKLGCELNSDWLFLEPVVKPVVDREEKIKECIKNNTPSLEEFDQYFDLADRNGNGNLSRGEIHKIYNKDWENDKTEIIDKFMEEQNKHGLILNRDEFANFQHSYWEHNCKEILGIYDEESFALAELKRTQADLHQDG